MKRILKWAGYGLAGVAGLVLVAVVGVFATSEMMIHRTASTPLKAIAVTHDSSAALRGRQIAEFQGCMDCHGDDLGGKLFHDEPALVRAWAPNLTLAAAHQSDAELERAIRHGVAADGRVLWIMPSSAFSRLSDAETADLIAFLKSQAPQGERQPRLQIGPVGRLGVLLGKFSSEPDMLKTVAYAQALPDEGEAYAEGRALARGCAECHGGQLDGNPDMKSPDLMIAASYDREDFEKLLRTGIAAGDRKVGLMTEIAPRRFAHLSDAQIDALQAYLKARASRQVALAETGAVRR